MTIFLIRGVKTGIFSRIDPAGWAPAYGLSDPGDVRESGFRDSGFALSFTSVLATVDSAGSAGDGSSTDGVDSGDGGGD